MELAAGETGVFVGGARAVYNLTRTWLGTAGHGKEYYDGDAQCTWRFQVLKVVAWQWLEALFTGTNASADVYMQTKTDDDTYDEFTDIMHKPEIGDSARRGIGAYFDVLVRFTKLEAYSP